jgi:tRNA (guanine10-N2)-dimethyltransferase
VANLFFLLSGEFETLSFSELKSILEAEGYAYSIMEKLDQTVRLTADIESVKQVQRRSAYTRICAQELFTCDANDEAITNSAAKTDFQGVLNEGETFEVRIRRIKEYSTKKDTMQLERSLGKLILQQASKNRVNLKTPDKTFFGILTNHKLVFGLRLAEIQPKPFVERRPRKKPFFHPSAMNAKLARCMVNLVQPRTGALVLDPFCGTGTTVLEAALIGCKPIGADVQRRMINGARKNLSHFGTKAEALIIADARQLPLTRVDCVVTDPPYGKSATTLKSSTRAIVEAVLKSASTLLREGQRICMASPKTLHIAELGESLGYTHLESHFAYVHRTLTREVAVFQKKAEGATAS